MRIEIVETASEARELSRKTGASIRPDEYPAIVILSFDPDKGIEGRPDVFILTWAQLVYMMLQKKRHQKTAAMLKWRLNTAPK